MNLHSLDLRWWHLIYNFEMKGILILWCLFTTTTKATWEKFLPFSSLAFIFYFHLLLLPFVAPARVWYSSENRNNQEVRTCLTYKKIRINYAKRKRKTKTSWRCIECFAWFANLSSLIPLKFTMNSIECKFSYHTHF
jgi:hypothetical protein